MSLAEKIERLYHQQTTDYGQEFFDAFKELKQGLNSGEIRAAEPAPGELTGWKVPGKAQRLTRPRSHRRRSRLWVTSSFPPTKRKICAVEQNR